MLVILWGLAGWYLGTKAEQEFKAYLQHSSQLVGKKLFRAELLSYKKNLKGANATLLVSSDFPLLSERIGDFELNVKLLNGPVFITKSGVSVGSSRWALRLAENEKLKEFFPEALPVANVLVDFEQKAHYQADVKTDFGESLITGIFNFKTEDNRGAVKLSNFSYGVLPDAVSANIINFSYQHQKAITTNYKPGTASVQISDLKISHKKLPKPLLLKLKANSNILLKNNELSGFIKADIGNQNSTDYPFETAKISLLFNGLSADGFIAYNEANAELENLKLQTDWVLEESGEYPEGQDQIWELYDRIEKSSKKLPQTLVALGKNSLMQIKASTHYQGQASHLDGTIKLATNNPNITSWLALLDGEAKVKLDKGLHAILKKLLPLNKPEFTLQLKRNKVLMFR